MDIDVRPNARVRYLGETRYMCPEQHAVLEFVAETIVKVAQEAVDTGVPYIEDPLTARLFLDKYRLLAEMDSDPARITEDCPVVPPTNDRMTMEIGDSEQGESSMPQGLSHGGTNRSSGTNNPTDQSAFNHPREYGISIRGRAAGHSFGRERNVNSFSAEPAHSAGIPTRYQEEPRRGDSYIPRQTYSPRERLRVPETYTNDERPLNSKGRKGRFFHRSRRVQPVPHCFRCLEEFPDKAKMFLHVRHGVCRQAEYNRHRRY